MSVQIISPLPDAAASLLGWYDANARVLPWRAPPDAASKGLPPPDAYGVWLSEIMLQQTTVAAVIPYYERFLARWPTVASLAAAPLEDVRHAWAGLGYYARARNLHACAQAVVRDHGGRFPATEAELLKLPGIGPYTAAAIASIAFGQRAVVVDGNVERVVSRLFAVEEELPAARPRRQPARLRASRGARSRRALPRNRGGTAQAARHRPLHGGGHRQHRLRPAGGGGGRQRGARRLPLVRGGGGTARRPPAPARTG